MKTTSALHVLRNDLSARPQAGRVIHQGQGIQVPGYRQGAACAIRPAPEAHQRPGTVLNMIDEFNFALQPGLRCAIQVDGTTLGQLAALDDVTLLTQKDDAALRGPGGKPYERKNFSCDLDHGSLQAGIRPHHASAPSLSPGRSISSPLPRMV